MDAFIGEIRLFAFGLTPEDWVVCDGSSLQTDKYAALYSVIGDRFGASRPGMFALPNLAGRAVIGARTNIGDLIPGDPLSPAYRATNVSLSAGSPKATVPASNVPDHSHTLTAIVFSPTPVAQVAIQMNRAPSSDRMVSRLIRNTATSSVVASYAKTADVTMASEAISETGEATSVEIDMMQPYLAMTPCICFNGEYPTED